MPRCSLGVSTRRKYQTCRINRVHPLPMLLPDGSTVQMRDAKGGNRSINTYRVMM